jgi:hypothetical protein
MLLHDYTNNLFTSPCRQNPNTVYDPLVPPGKYLPDFL